MGGSIDGSGITRADRQNSEGVLMGGSIDGSGITKVVDARGLACPIPVVKTKKALEEVSLEVSEKSPFTLVTLVDNDMAAQNVSRMAQNSGYEVSVEKDGAAYRVIIKKGSEEASPALAPGPSVSLEAPEVGETRKAETHKAGTVFVISSDTLGTGEEELGTALMSSFLFALSNADNPPSTLIFINRGVYITTKGTRHEEALKTLSSKGVNVISCGTCLDYYHLKDLLIFGVVGNMYGIVEEILSAQKVIWI
ncbi:MAG TPA: sulfurtransferase-like selenium metabolism protein YedF [Clostridia bacterium]|nr:sulfurtransferase-like selenium metabolism protein YedF [Clostridia bacterium]